MLITHLPSAMNYRPFTPGCVLQERVTTLPALSTFIPGQEEMEQQDLEISPSLLATKSGFREGESPCMEFVKNLH